MAIFTSNNRLKVLYFTKKRRNKLCEAAISGIQ